MNIINPLKDKSDNPQTNTNIPNCGVYLCSHKLNTGYNSGPILLNKIAGWSVSEVRLKKLKTEVNLNKYSHIYHFSLTD